METKGRSIELIGFREELIASGRKLLYCDFKDKFRTYRYVWMPSWKGEGGVERLFFKALEIEEWNDYEGVWDKELKKAATEIPLLEDTRLPIELRVGSIELSGMKPNEGDEEEAYKVTVEIRSDEVLAWELIVNKKSFICIGQIRISWDSLKSFLLEQANIRAVSRGIKTVTEWRGDEWEGERTHVHGDWENVGVSFDVWLETGADKLRYQVIGREIASNIRSFIRKCLSDFHALKRGFEES